MVTFLRIRKSLPIIFQAKARVNPTVDGTIKIVPGVLWPHRIGWIGERLFLGIYKGILHIRTPRKLDSDWACHWEQFIIPVGKITHEIGCFFRRNECYPSVLNFYHSCWSPLA